MSHLAAFKQAVFALFTASWSPSITRCWFYVHVLLELFHLLCPQHSCWWLCLAGNSLEQGSDLRSVTENTWLNQRLLILPPSSGSVLQINQHTKSTAAVFALPGKRKIDVFQNLLINNFTPPLSSDELLYRLILFVCSDARPLLLSLPKRKEEHVWWVNPVSLNAEFLLNKWDNTGEESKFIYHFPKRNLTVLLMLFEPEQRSNVCEAVRMMKSFAQVHAEL